MKVVFEDASFWLEIIQASDMRTILDPNNKRKKPTERMEIVVKVLAPACRVLDRGRSDLFFIIDFMERLFSLEKKRRGKFWQLPVL